MLITAETARLPLLPGQLMRIQLAPRTRFVGVAGQAWLTLDHDLRDIVLGPGEEFVAVSAGHATVSALRRDAEAELLVTQ